MAIAIIHSDALQTFIKGIGFPYDHRMNLDKGGVGFDAFDKFIRANVQWVPELSFDKEKHVKVWGSARVTGPVPQPEDFYSRSVFTGTEEINQFKPWAQQDAHEGNSPAHANFIGATFALSTKYIADFKETADGKVDVSEYIRVLVSEVASESYLGYGILVPVEKLWDIHYKTDGKDRFWVERSEHGVDNIEHFYVREVTNQGEINNNFKQDEEGVWSVKVKEGVRVTDKEVPTAVDLTGFSDTSDTYTSISITDEETKAALLQVEVKSRSLVNEIKCNLGL
ncbi:hypothetical protein PHABIO_338 [Pseudomonas phage Phabio]|uniref:Uncharacterized protein n=1 Tax=Pseudomonas phage Phabio TaxID=2006668 RepID=A0A1Y0SZL5_9CAUD|nr:hypothetical protein MZD05_gp338 [Pseudomonas phage Phabio]ARV76969.1 hypothetical protein PHABIO_338 [Pseudomonas phage Phabio]